MGIISDIRGTLKEIPLSDIIRERLIMAERDIEKLEKENVNLKEENSRLKKENNELNERLARLTIAKDEFVEAHGALFKHKPGGGYHETVYCPGCKMPLSSFGGDFPYSCDKCSVHLDFYLKDLPTILKELPQ